MGLRKDQIWIISHSYSSFEGYKGGNLWVSVLGYCDILEIAEETKDGTIMGKTYGRVVVFDEVIKLGWLIVKFGVPHSELQTVSQQQDQKFKQGYYFQLS